MSARAWYESLTSTVITVCGTLFNTFSLVYFIRRDREHLGSRLLMLLNVFDLCVCSTASLVVFTELYHTEGDYYESKVLDVLMGLYVAAGESTAFATCLLSVTRSVCLCLPFKRINNQTIVLSTVGFLLYITGRETAYIALMWCCYDWDKMGTFVAARNYLTMISISCIILIVVTSNLISIVKVRRARGCTDLVAITKRAAVTVLLVSCNFCFYSTTFVVLFGVFLNIPASKSDAGLLFLEFLTFRVFVPLNSATNPLIYLIRKNEMRIFVKNCVRRLTFRKRNVIGNVNGNSRYTFIRVKTQNRQVSLSDVIP